MKTEERCGAVDPNTGLTCEREVDELGHQKHHALPDGNPRGRAIFWDNEDFVYTPMPSDLRRARRRGATPEQRAEIKAMAKRANHASLVKTQTWWAYTIAALREFARLNSIELSGRQTRRSIIAKLQGAGIEPPPIAAPASDPSDSREPA